MKRAMAVVLLLTWLVAGCAIPRAGGKQSSMTQNESGSGNATSVTTSASTTTSAATIAEDHSRNALIAAIGGALAGTAVEAYMDRHKQALDKTLAMERNANSIAIIRQDDHVLKIIMTGPTAFETGSATIKPAYISTMDKLARIVNEYRKTTLTVVGHTDNTGTTENNRKLSEARALAVGRHLRQKDVQDSRLREVGKGELEPRADNDVEEGRRLNRRVEILVEPVVAD
jgi:outer membrane protein OmpA-like peptidoglycan-associated protein